jgi:hypothetical protein
VVQRYGFSAARAAHSYLKDNADQLFICTTAPSSYSAASTQPQKVVSANVTAGDWTQASAVAGPAIGFKQRTVLIEGSGSASHLVFAKSSGSTILIMTDVCGAPLVSGGSVIIPQWRVEASAGDIGFSPTHISNLQFWYDFSDTTTVTVSGVQIQQIYDKSGNNRTAGPLFKRVGSTNTRPALTATTLGNLRIAAEFDASAGAGYALRLPDLTGAGYTAASAFIVVQRKPDAEGLPGAWHYGADITSNFNHMPYLDNVIYEPSLTSTRITTSAMATVTAHALYSWSIRSQTGHWNAHINGNPHYATSSNTFGLAANGHIGTGENTATPGLDVATWHGWIGEVIFYSRYLTPSEMNQVGDYLATKWGHNWATIS